MKVKCTEGLLYHVGAHLKALGVLVWILGPESTTARVLLCQSWLQCALAGFVAILGEQTNCYFSTRAH